MKLASGHVSFPARATPRWLPALSGHLSGLILTLFLATFSSWPCALQASPAVDKVCLGSGQRVFHPGEDVPLSWTALPQGTNEFELLLVCRSPIHVTFRLTECMDPLQGTFRWQVPNVPCDTAQIFVRTGVDGEEITWAASPPFRIAWESRDPFVQVSSRGGELWLSDSSPMSRGTFAWGPDSAAPGSLPDRRDDVGTLSPDSTLLAPDTSSRELVRERGQNLGRTDSHRPRPSHHLKLQLRI